MIVTTASSYIGRGFSYLPSITSRGFGASLRKKKLHNIGKNEKSGFCYNIGIYDEKKISQKSRRKADGEF